MLYFHVPLYDREVSAIIMRDAPNLYDRKVFFMRYEYDEFCMVRGGLPSVRMSDECAFGKVLYHLELHYMFF